MVLDDITDDAILVEVPSPPFCAEVFTEDDLDIADVLPAPQRLKHQVCKSKDLHKIQSL